MVSDSLNYTPFGGFQRKFPPLLGSRGFVRIPSACENGHIDPESPVSNWSAAWNRACKIAAVPGLGFHGLHHSAATKLLKTGVPFAVVAHILGWPRRPPSKWRRGMATFARTCSAQPLRKYRQTGPPRRCQQSRPLDFPESGHKIGHSRERVLESDVRM